MVSSRHKEYGELAEQGYGCAVEVLTPAFHQMICRELGLPRQYQPC
jgi:hypothetical protein